MAKCPNCEKTHQYSVVECLNKDTAERTVTVEKCTVTDEPRTVTGHVTDEGGLTRQQLWDKKNREKMNAYRREKMKEMRRRRKESSR